VEKLISASLSAPPNLIYLVSYTNLDATQTKVTVGAGGAVVALSDPDAEFEEMKLKAQSVLPSLAHVYQNHFQD
jgi:hypothetical protein